MKFVVSLADVKVQWWSLSAGSPYLIKATPPRQHLFLLEKTEEQLSAQWWVIKLEDGGKVLLHSHTFNIFDDPVSRIFSLDNSNSRLALLRKHFGLSREDSGCTIPSHLAHVTQLQQSRYLASHPSLRATHLTHLPTTKPHLSQTNSISSTFKSSVIYSSVVFEIGLGRSPNSHLISETRLARHAEEVFTKCFENRVAEVALIVMYFCSTEWSTKGGSAHLDGQLIDVMAISTRNSGLEFRANYTLDLDKALMKRDQESSTCSSSKFFRRRFTCHFHTLTSPSKYALARLTMQIYFLFRFSIYATCHIFSQAKHDTKGSFIIPSFSEPKPNATRGHEHAHAPIKNENTWTMKKSEEI
ncbi:uncharacterized protein BDR25DRAFT_394179 [Lindgomyces ingoldianus]|uniref:Uncharacterized protein n=1 Tax=Lindgomyces ingoldianus TaxID=673940 RepID=A0ACB6QS47_9PLEO|nr:uncharacterized protein BDR25DRAFT_394179 [Lindgomyces ingoldianus]KAF2469814.1 hypothetical protein BDR25DRAFT_394179 [Lindgomyces ingoldianus]